MISLYGGRLQLISDRADRTWHARVILGPKPEHQVERSTGTIVLQEALQRGQVIYREAVAQIRPAGSQRMCWDCLQWNPQRNQCELRIPECRRSGGRYALRCEMFDAALPSPD